jgi:hypothetical protein
MFTYTKHTVGAPISHFRAWRLQKNFPLTATIEMLVNVPRWRPGGVGHDFWVRAMHKGPKTVAEAIALGKEIGLTAGEVQGHLRWLYTWGDQVKIGGHQYASTAQIETIGPELVPAPAPAEAPKAKGKNAKASA